MKEARFTGKVELSHGTVYTVGGRYITGFLSDYVGKTVTVTVSVEKAWKWVRGTDDCSYLVRDGDTVSEAVARVSLYVHDPRTYRWEVIGGTQGYAMERKEAKKKALEAFRKG